MAPEECCWVKLEHYLANFKQLNLIELQTRISANHMKSGENQDSQSQLLLKRKIP